jgi:hypothetical protein
MGKTHKTKLPRSKSKSKKRTKKSARKRNLGSKMKSFAKRNKWALATVGALATALVAHRGYNYLYPPQFVPPTSMPMLAATPTLTLTPTPTAKRNQKPTAFLTATHSPLVTKPPPMPTAFLTATPTITPNPSHTAFPLPTATQTLSPTELLARVTALPSPNPTVSMFPHELAVRRDWTPERIAETHLPGAIETPIAETALPLFSPPPKAPSARKVQAGWKPLVTKPPPMAKANYDDIPWIPKVNENNKPTVIPTPPPPPTPTGHTNRPFSDFQPWMGAMLGAPFLIAAGVQGVRNYMQAKKDSRERRSESRRRVHAQYTGTPYEIAYSTEFY